MNVFKLLLIVSSISIPLIIGIFLITEGAKANQGFMLISGFLSVEAAIWFLTKDWDRVWKND